ncbi:MAG: HAMP domain-containing histidine kinase [Lachnospiraceae bacterium]|nr:HAMP domain-containing histidine kinase [Lachnospiraceae bacterium]
MKELRKKTYLTIFAMLSMILLTVLVLVNVHAYVREEEGVRRNLNILEDRGRRDESKEPRPGAGGQEDAPRDAGLKPRDLENMMVMDYELYTVEVENGEIAGIYSHGNSSEDFDPAAVAGEILIKEKEDCIRTGNLYFSRYSYRYRYMESIVILNDSELSGKLWELLAESLVLLAVLEVLIALISRRITAWITKPAAEAFERQKEFIADASHELKTPLAVIMASADEISSSEGEAQYLENIRYESERMNRLITGLLNLSKLENREDPSSLPEENLSRILEKTCLSYEGVAFEQGVSIETEIEEGLRLKCNRDEIEQMAATVLDNAVRHSYRDTRVRVIAARLKAKNGIEIKVINSGDPIPEEEREKIFERFYRGDQARSRKDNRYGLGLAIARRIARNHNGDIRAHSEGGETVFRIILK